MGGNKEVFTTRGEDSGFSGALYRCRIMTDQTGFRMEPTYIGTSLPAGVQTLTFPPGQANDLWLGSDDGIFYTSRPTDNSPGIVDNLFEPRNTGLATLMANR